jgi:hypothetical protein
MYSHDKFVKHSRIGRPEDFDAVIDTYEFKPGARNGQVSKVVVMFEPGPIGLTTIVYVLGKAPMQAPHHDWGQAKVDLGRTLSEHQCDPFTIKDPRQP